MHFTLGRTQLILRLRPRLDWGSWPDWLAPEERIFRWVWIGFLEIRVFRKERE